MKARDLIDSYLQEHRTLSDIEESNRVSTKVQLVWDKLPSNLKRKIDFKRLGDFLEALLSGFSLNDAAAEAKLNVPQATDLLAAVERTGLV